MAFSFGQQTAAPAFGASSASLFGAAATPAFGAASSPSLFGGGAAPSPFGGAGAVSTPAFNFAQSSASLFGGASASGSLFGAATPAFGATSSPSLFGAAAASPPSPFGQPQPFQAQQQQQPQQQLQQEQQLVTKDNHPVTHSTKWDDLSPQAQQYLTELQSIILRAQGESDQLQGEERLKESTSANEKFNEETMSLARGITSAKSAVEADRRDAEGVRTDVMHLLRHTEAVLSSFKRAYAWREASKTSTGQLPSHLAEQLGGPIALPSPFLPAAIQDLIQKARVQRAAAADLEAALQRSKTTDRDSAAGIEAATALHSLQAAITNLHDCLVHGAAKLQAVDERVGQMKERYLNREREAGHYVDPFAMADREEAASKDKGMKSKSEVKGMQSQMQAPGGGGAMTQPVAIGATGLFGTVSPTSTGFGTPLTGMFGNTAAGANRRKGRR